MITFKTHTNILPNMKMDSFKSGELTESHSTSSTNIEWRMLSKKAHIVLNTTSKILDRYWNEHVELGLESTTDMAGYMFIL
uniref:Uncharacterized protein n=1 Tax=Arion vulgaris TaxID=1028688 RepID=A0A0B7B468_9EUPU